MENQLPAFFSKGRLGFFQKTPRVLLKFGGPLCCGNGKYVTRMELVISNTLNAVPRIHLATGRLGMGETQIKKSFDQFVHHVRYALRRPKIKAVGKGAGRVRFATPPPGSSRETFAGWCIYGSRTRHWALRVPIRDAVPVTGEKKGDKSGGDQRQKRAEKIIRAVNQKDADQDA